MSASDSSLLVTPEQLSAELATAHPPLVIDLRAADQFIKGLIPSAVHFDLWGFSLNDTSEAPLRAFMWTAGHLFSQRGVTADRGVVVYEANSGMRSARAFWFLEYLGHPSVRVLDGGIDAWIKAGLPTTTDARAPKASSWHGTPDPSRIATWQQVFDRLGKADSVIIDTRSDEEYYGVVARAARAGAIPGAVHMEWTENLDAEGRYKPAAALRQMYAEAGITPDREAVTYCQGGYRAAHTYLALRLLGYPRIRNYTGSWKEWGDRVDLPHERIDKPKSRT